MQLNSHPYRQSQLEQQRRSLEALLTPSRPATLGHRLQQIAHQFAGAMVNFLAPQDSLKITHSDRLGQTLWSVYDRETQQRYRFSSEDELRVWLDERHHH
jgi:hypothetical protein